MPASVVRTAEDERHWQEAKKQAKKQGRSKDYAYIMGIFQRMSGKKSLADRLADMVKARSTKPLPGQMSLFGEPAAKKPAAPVQGHVAKPPKGFQPVPHSKKGGFVKVMGGKRVYWYPGQGIVEKPHEADAGATPHQEATAKHVMDQIAKLEGKKQISLQEIEHTKQAIQNAWPGGPQTVPQKVMEHMKTLQKIALEGAGLGGQYPARPEEAPTEKEKPKKPAVDHEAKASHHGEQAGRHVAAALEAPNDVVKRRHVEAAQAHQAAYEAHKKARPGGKGAKEAIIAGDAADALGTLDDEGTPEVKIKRIGRAPATFKEIKQKKKQAAARTPEEKKAAREEATAEKRAEKKAEEEAAAAKKKKADAAAKRKAELEKKRDAAKKDLNDLRGKLEKFGRMQRLHERMHEDSLGGRKKDKESSVIYGKYMRARSAIHDAIRSPTLKNINSAVRLAEEAEFSSGNPDKILAKQDEKQHADSENFRYPLDTKENTQASMAEFKKNKANYNKKEQEEIGSKIQAAMKRHGLEAPEDSRVIGKDDKGNPIEAQHTPEHHKKMESHHSKLARRRGASKTERAQHRRAAKLHDEALRAHDRLSLDRSRGVEPSAYASEIAHYASRDANYASGIAHWMRPVDAADAAHAASKEFGINKSMSKALPPAGKTGGCKTPPKGYPESKKQYADPANFKYPLDTEKHVRAAISYFSKPKNAGVYSGEQQRAIWGRIKSAAKKRGIELSEESGPPSVGKALREDETMRPQSGEDRISKPTQKSLRVNRCTVHLDHDEALSKAIEDGELGIGTVPRTHASKAMIRKSVVGGEGFTERGQDARETVARAEQDMAVVRDDPAGNCGNGGLAEWFADAQKTQDPAVRTPAAITKGMDQDQINVVDDSDPYIQRMHRADPRTKSAAFDIDYAYNRDARRSR